MKNKMKNLQLKLMIDNVIENSLSLFLNIEKYNTIFTNKSSKLRQHPFYIFSTCSEKN